MNAEVLLDCFVKNVRPQEVANVYCMQPHTVWSNAAHPLICSLVMLDAIIVISCPGIRNILGRLTEM
jgi:hypothetical protein